MAAKGYQPPSRAELQAMRASKGAPSVGPVFEATRRAKAIRDGLDKLTTLTEQIIESFRQEDWKTLGYASFTAYTQAEFGERLNLTPAQRSVLAITFTEAGMSRRAAAAAIGVDESTVRQDLKVAGNPAGHKAISKASPQVKAPVIDGETVTDDSGDTDETAADSDASADGADGPAEGAIPSPTAAPAGGPAGVTAPPVGSPVTPDPSTGEVESPQPSAPPVEVSSPSPVSGSDSHEQAAPGQEAGQDVPAPTSPRDDLLVGGPGLDSPAGQPPASDTPEDPAPVATHGQPGQDLSPEDSGDASNAESSSPDLTDPESLVRHLEQFVAGLDHVDIDVLGPLMTEELLARAHKAADNLAWLVGMLTTWSEKR